MKNRTVFSNLTIASMCMMAVYCAAGSILALITGDTWKYLPVPPGFIYILALYWVSLIRDIRIYCKKTKKRRRNRRRTALTAETALKKAG